jgi:ATP-binding cassette subfamily F protein uup
LDGQGRIGQFADYSQWDVWQAERKQPKEKPSAAASAESAPVAPLKKKLSYLEAREYDSLEQRIAEAEQVVKEKRSALEAPPVLADGRLLQDAYRELQDAQTAVDELYGRWAELEEKIS